MHPKMFIFFLIGRWTSSYYMWHSKLCCSWGTDKCYATFMWIVYRNTYILVTLLTIYSCYIQVLNDRGYDGATADLWSCGVILFVLVAGYLPFDDPNLMNLYKKVSTVYTFLHKFSFSFVFCLLFLISWSTDLSCWIYLPPMAFFHCQEIDYTNLGSRSHHCKKKHLIICLLLVI